MQKRQNGRKRKMLISTIGTLVIISLIASAGLFSNFVQQQQRITVTGLFTWDGQDAGDLSVTNSFSTVGNTTHNFTHTIVVANHNNGDIPIQFVWSANPADCITDGTITTSIALRTVDIPITTLLLEPDTTYDVNFSYVVDILAIPQEYVVNCTITPL